VPADAARGNRIVTYLAYQLLWYLLIAFVVGLFVGWTSAGPAED
jgi:hypothetical protein